LKAIAGLYELPTPAILVIDPTAEPSGYLDFNELHKATIYRQQTQTLYVRWDWLTPLLVLGTIAWWINAGINKHR